MPVHQQQQQQTRQLQFSANQQTEKPAVVSYLEKEQQNLSLNQRRKMTKSFAQIED
jgi:hypothetical protein